MIFNNDKEITLVYRGRVPILAIYRGITLVWQSVRSCYGSGCWINEKPWSNEEGWKN